MKKGILFFLLISFSGFSQNLDYSKMSKEELIKIINSKENEIKKNKELAVANENKAKASGNNDAECRNKLVKVQETIKKTNEIFLKDIFIGKYVTDKNYFNQTDLTTEVNTKKFENSNVLINSILIDESSSKEEKEIGKKALGFNDNYLTLFKIRETVLNVKYNKENVAKAISDISKLPTLESDSKLEASKNRTRNYLENYLKSTCELKIILEKLKKNPDQNSVFKQQYSKLENKEEYKAYPYLIQVIKKIKNNVKDYSNDDLQPCEEIKTDPIENINKDETNGNKDVKEIEVKKQ